MRLFNDMVSSHPRLRQAGHLPRQRHAHRRRAGDWHGLRLLHRQDLARFGQAGPKHGSAPIGGATDFLPVIVGLERAMVACVLCEPVSAHEAYCMGMITRPRAGAQGRRPLCPEPAGRDDTHGRRTRPACARQAAQGRCAEGGQGTAWPARHGRSVGARRKGRDAVQRSSSTRSPTAPPRRSRSCASRSSTPGTGTRKTRAPGSRST